MERISATEFEKRYGGTAAPIPRITPTKSFWGETKQDLIDTALGVGGAAFDAFNKASDVIQNPRFNPIQKTTGVLGAVAGGASNVFGEAVIGAGKAVLPQSAEDAVKQQVQKIIGGVITPEKAKKVQEWYNKLDENNKLVVDSAGGIGQFMFDVVTLGTAKPVAMGAKTAVETGAQTTKQTAETAFKDALNLRTRVQEYVGKESVGPQVQESVTRLTKPTPTKVTAQSGGGAVMKPTFLEGTAQRAEDVVTKYDTYLAQSEKAINDIKADPAIAVVGEKMGDAFNDVARQTRAIGAQLGDELKEVGKLRVAITDAASKFITDLKESGLHYNPKTRDFMAPSGTAFADDEINMIQEFMNRMRLLGTSPTVRDINNFIARSRSELAFTKGKAGVMGTTNAERIINGALAGLRESTNPKVNGIQQLEKYFALNKTYSDLKDFLEEGGQFLGKKTQTGDYAKDASLAKSAVQSILNNGKKDWMLKLEALSGYNALDDAVLALQAMKDAGDYRGTSLLQVIKDGGLPTSKAGAVAQIVDYGVDLGKRAIAGKPSEQTRAFLKSLQKTAKVDLKVADKVVQAGKDVVKTKEITAIESKIAKNVAAQKVAIKAGDFTLVATLKEVYQILVQKLKDAIKYLNENGSVGMTIKKSVTPESVARKADKGDMNVLAKVIDDYDNAILDPKTNATLDGMGLGRATREERISFAKEVFNEKDGVAMREVVKPKDMTASEAKKAGMTFEEWVGTQGEMKYHQTSPENASKIEKEGFRLDKLGSGNSDVLPLGVNTKSHNRELLIQGKGEQMEVFVPKTANVKKFETRQQAESFFRMHDSELGNEYYKAYRRYQETDKKYLQIMRERDELQNKLIKDKAGRDALRKHIEEDTKIIDEWDKEGMVHSKDMQRLATEISKKDGIDAIEIVRDEGGFGRVTDNLIVLDPSQIKTRSQLKAEWDKAN